MELAVAYSHLLSMLNTAVNGELNLSKLILVYLEQCLWHYPKIERILPVDAHHHNTWQEYKNTTTCVQTLVLHVQWFHNVFVRKGKISWWNPGKYAFHGEVLILHYTTRTDAILAETLPHDEVSTYVEQNCPSFVHMLDIVYVKTRQQHTIRQKKRLAADFFDNS